MVNVDLGKTSTKPIICTGEVSHRTTLNLLEQQYASRTRTTGLRPLIDTPEPLCNDSSIQCLECCQQGSPTNPTFLQFQIIVLTDPKLINSLFLPTSTAPGKIEKCPELSTITKTLSIPPTPSAASQIPLTISPPMMSLKYWHGCHHWNHGYSIETLEPSGWTV